MEPPRPPCPGGYRCPWHRTLGVSEFCCLTRPGRAIKSTGAGMPQGEKQRGEMPASPSTCDVAPRSHVFAGSSIPARALTGPHCRWDAGALWAVPPCFCGPWGSRCAQAVPGALQLHGADGCCQVLHFGAVQPCLSHPCAGAAPNDQATTLHHPFTGFNTHRSTEGGAWVMRTHSKPAAVASAYPWKCESPPPHPRTGAELQHNSDVPVSPPTRVSQDEDPWARGGKKQLEVTLARQCHHLPAVPALISTLL